MIGGGAFTAFADQLIEKLPEGTIGILGEGEDAILKVIDGQPLDDERYILRENGRVSQRYEAGDRRLLDALDSRSAISHVRVSAISRICRRVHRRAEQTRLPLRLRVLPVSIYRGKARALPSAGNGREGYCATLSSLGRPPILVYRCPVYYREGSLSPVH